MCAYEAKKCVCMSKYAHTYLCHECPCFWTKHYENCTVHFYVMTLILKFHKDLSFCWGDMCKITLNMHARAINACAKFQYTRVHVFASCAQIFTKFFLVVHYSVISISFKCRYCIFQRYMFLQRNRCFYPVWYLGESFDSDTAVPGTC